MTATETETAIETEVETDSPGKVREQRGLHAQLRCFLGVG